MDYDIYDEVGVFDCAFTPKEPFKNSQFIYNNGKPWSFFLLRVQI